MGSTIIASFAVPLGLIVIMFGMGLSLSTDDFKRIVLLPRAVLIGTFAQILVLPATGFACARLFGLTGEMAVGLIVLSACAGGATSNILSYLAKGDIALSVTLTAISSCVSIFTLPVVANLALMYFMATDTDIKLPLVQTISSLLMVTILPVLAGMATRHNFSHFSNRAMPVVQNLSLAVLFIIILGSIFMGRDVAVDSFMVIGPAGCALNVFCMAAGYSLARLFRLSEKQCATITIEVGVQNVATAVFVTTTLLKSPAMSLPAAIYSLPMFFSACVYAALRRRKSRVA